MVKLSIAIFGLVATAMSKWAPEHEFSPQASAQIAKAIKDKLLAGVFVDAAFGNSLKADLNNNDDSKRTLKEISATNAANIWTVLGLDDPKCDANNDGTVKGDELKCLNWAWKAFVPS